MFIVHFMVYFSQVILTVDYIGICNFAGIGFRISPTLLHCLCFFAMVARNYLVLRPCLIDSLATFDTASSLSVHDAVLYCSYDCLSLIFFHFSFLFLSHTYWRALDPILTLLVFSYVQVDDHMSPSISHLHFNVPLSP